MPRPEIAPIVILEADSTLDMLQIANLEEIRFKAQSSKERRRCCFMFHLFFLHPLAEHVVTTVRDEGDVLLHARLLAQLLVHCLDPSCCQY